MIEPKTPIAGRGKFIRIKALTKMIPAAKVKQELKNFAAMLIPIVPTWILEFDEDEKHYLVPRSQVDLLVSDEDVDDWNYLLERFDKILAGLTKLLNNIRKIDYHRIVHDKLLEQEIINRRVKLNEKLLEKTDKEPKKDKKEALRVKLKELDGILATLVAGALPKSYNVDPLDAATIKEAQASGADLIAAAHLSTLEASGAQNAADVFQVILNRSKNRKKSVAEVITAREQFSPYSAAIYGTSADTKAASVYGNLRVTKKEIFELAAKPDGLKLLVDRFNNGNAAIAQQVLDDFKTSGPLSEASKTFVGGAEYFMGYETGGLNERRRGPGGNYFRDAYSSGAILLPQLFDRYDIMYNTNDKTDDLANFIVDRPTILDVSEIGEPLVVIPTQRPIGQEIMNILFKEPFRKLETIFLDVVEKKQSKEKSQRPIQNSNTSINRSPIPESSRPTSNYFESQRTKYEQSIDANKVVSEMSGYVEDKLSPLKTKIDAKLSSSTAPLQRASSRSVSNIDTISQKTNNVFGNKLILLTQDIYATEE